MSPTEVAGYVDIVFKILEISAIISGIALGLRQMGKDSAKTQSKLDQQDGKLDRQDKVMDEMKEDIKLLNKVITEVAMQNQRSDLMAKQLERLERLVDELRHGNAWVTKTKREDLDGEY